MALIFTSCASFHGREPASAKNSQQEYQQTETGVDAAFAGRDFASSAK
jgi:hypothetical protein